MKPLLITMGDPAGVGAEIALQALRQGAAENRPVVLVGEPRIWRRAAELVGVTDPSAYPILAIDDCGLDRMTELADPRDEHLRARGAAQIAAIERAVRACLQGEAAGVVTMPIDKRALAAAGSAYPGHTEMIAAQCGVPLPVMMLFGPDLRVVPLTTHLPYIDVPKRLTGDLILQTLRIVHRDVRRLFGIAAPRLAVCGLNPHAGEGGLFGDEEIRIIAPALAAARAEGVEAIGPLPADSAFAFRDRYDVILCPTHDQALIPLKQLYFDSGVNATLGLPIVRTSPDHGTARDLAWQGRANCKSAHAAIRAAVAFITRLDNESA